MQVQDKDTTINGHTSNIGSVIAEMKATKLLFQPGSAWEWDRRTSNEGLAAEAPGCTKNQQRKTHCTDPFVLPFVFLCPFCAHFVSLYGAAGLPRQKTEGAIKKLDQAQSALSLDAVGSLKAPQLFIYACFA